MNQSLALLTILISLTAVGLWLEQRFVWASRVGASLIILILAAIFSNLGIIPSQAPVYEWIYGPVTSLAIVWLLLLVNLGELRKLGRKTLLAFAISILGTLLGGIVASAIFQGHFGPDTGKLGASLTASYIGGSLNFIAVGRGVGLPDNLFSGATAADNLLTALWMGMTLVLPSSLGYFLPPSELDSSPSVSSPGKGILQTNGFAALDLAILLGVGLGIIQLAEGLHQWLPGIPAIVWLTTLSLALAQFGWVRLLRGTSQLGIFGLNLFFTVIGAGSHLGSVLNLGLEIIGFALVIVTVHGLITFGFGVWLGLDMELLAIASQAAIGGPSTAMAQAMGRQRTHLVLPAVTLGLLGYAIGNYIGFSFNFIFEAIS